MCVEDTWREGVPPERDGIWGEQVEKQIQVPLDHEFMRREACTSV